MLNKLTSKQLELMRFPHFLCHGNLDLGFKVWTLEIDNSLFLSLLGFHERVFQWIKGIFQEVVTSVLYIQLYYLAAKKCHFL